MNVSPAAAARELLAREDARDSLLGFTQYTFPTFQPGEHHRTICNALERVERGECKRLMIFAPPRHTKSELASRRFPAWFIGRNPQSQIITATYGQDFADDFGRDVRNIVRSDEYRNVFPGTALAEDSTAQKKWRTNQGGIYIAAGVEGPINGRGAHLALIDDPFKDQAEADSETRRNSVWDWYTGVFRIRLMPQGRIVIIMTRWHDDDLAGRLLKAAQEGNGEQWEVVSMPAVADGLALWPEWFPMEELDAIKMTIGPRKWQALYQQQPTAEEGDYFKAEWFRHYTEAPTSLNVYLSGDFAVTDADGDYTELAAWGVDPLGNLYALDWWSGQQTADIWIAALLNMVRRWKPTRFIGEGGPIRRAIEPFLAKAMNETRTYCATEWLTGGGDKTANARSFQAMMACGRVYFPRTEWAEKVRDQLLRFPHAKHDDKVDTCSLMGRDLERAWAAIAPKKPEPPPDFGAPLLMADLMKPRKVASW